MQKNDIQREITIVDLPDEVWIRIFSLLNSIRYKLNVSEVCRRWHYLAHEPDRLRLKNSYPKIYAKLLAHIEDKAKSKIVAANIQDMSSTQIYYYAKSLYCYPPSSKKANHLFSLQECSIFEAAKSSNLSRLLKLLGEYYTKNNAQYRIFIELKKQTYLSAFVKFIEAIGGDTIYQLRDRHYYTPIDYLSQVCLDALFHLIDNNASTTSHNLRETDRHGFSREHWLAICNQHHLLDGLSEYEIERSYLGGDTILFYAAKHGRIEFIIKVLEGSNYFYTSHIDRVFAGLILFGNQAYLKKFMTLLDSLFNKFHMSSLSYFGSKDTLRELLFSAIEKNRYEVLDWLKAKLNMDVNSCFDKEVLHKRISPLHYAVQLGHVECVSWLLKQDNIEIDYQLSNNLTPLAFAIVACRCDKADQIEIIKLLINAGAKILLPFKTHYHPIAITNNEEIFLLLVNHLTTEDKQHHTVQAKISLFLSHFVRNGNIDGIETLLKSIDVFSWDTLDMKQKILNEIAFVAKSIIHFQKHSYANCDKQKFIVYQRNIAIFLLLIERLSKQNLKLNLQEKLNILAKKFHQEFQKFWAKYLCKQDSDAIPEILHHAVMFQISPPPASETASADTESMNSDLHSAFAL